MNLIVGESMSLNILDSKGFRQFCHDLDPRYKHVSRLNMKERIHSKSVALQKEIAEKMNNTDSVNTTVDIWSDRKMRSFLGVTAHIIEESNDELNLKSYTLACHRFLGKHTGNRIASTFEKIINDYKIRGKIDYIITDNASNMKKAFATSFSSKLTSDDEEDIATTSEAQLDANTVLADDTIWLSLEDECDYIVEITNSAKKSRLSCYAHTLQLCIRDGLDQSQCKSLVPGVD